MGSEVLFEQYKIQSIVYVNAMSHGDGHRDTHSDSESMGIHYDSHYDEHADNNNM